MIYLGRLLSTVFLMSSFVSGYSYKTHSYLGKVTEQYLDKYYTDILYNIKQEINGSSISEISTWADRIKNKQEYQWSKTLHYIDILDCGSDVTESLVDEYCGGNCIVSAILEYTYRIKNRVNKPNDVSDHSEEFKFLIHFLQDFSQPLHLVGFYRGGNTYKVIRNRNGHNKTTNLHFLWDSEVPEYFVSNYAKEWYLEFIEEHDFETLADYYQFLLNILNENKNVACDYIYGTYKDTRYIVFDEYFDEKYQRLLFKNYLDLVVNTFRYMYQLE